MKNILIVPNTLKEKSVNYADYMKSLLESKGCRAEIYNGDTMPDFEPELAIVLGGDGTILRASKLFYGKQILLFGINFGNLGYLSAISPEDDVENAINRLLSGDFYTEKRTMLEGEIIRKGKKVIKFIGLNEACVSRSSLMHAFSAELMINMKHIETIVGDGVIISTPTGSTAYNLSAGGPILTPTSKNMVITPVSATYFSSASIVIDDNDKLEIVVRFSDINENGAPCIEIDGETRYMLQDGDIIKIKRAKYATKIAKITDKSFYQILKQKLSKASLDY